MGKLADTVVVVTGASRGLGAAMATGFASEGASVVLAARTVADLESVAARCREAGAVRVEVIPTDVTREDHVNALVQTTLERLGRLDVFVANAGIAVPGITDKRMTTLDTYELDVVERLIAVNTVGMWLSMKAALPVMPAGGSFIAIGSELGRLAGAGAGVYAITKASVDLLVRIAAAESAERGVRVNCLSPGGMVDTHLFGPGGMPAHIKAHAPWSEPTVIVPAAVWLASRDSDGVTGKRLAGTDFNRTPPKDLRATLQDA
ncbi:SDR family NAD(P)-dependent oxidoreductase [Tessaracoccus antarcticus]|uniref:SDR family oxidoreductase n=1 Tax=Tessaracoccus antarcticus TaxID=2479848 RepID=A0A3M0G5S2_9ACTN|nr:SDR family oxidoreductase [Tessaracoccus antarcticus]RMB59908.1 SDR family oxidoreductase [Tessaracoccus antarcticus]